MDALPAAADVDAQEETAPPRLGVEDPADLAAVGGAAEDEGEGRQHPPLVGAVLGHRRRRRRPQHHRYRRATRARARPPPAPHSPPAPPPLPSLRSPPPHPLSGAQTRKLLDASTRARKQEDAIAKRRDAREKGRHHKGDGGGDGRGSGRWSLTPKRLAGRRSSRSAEPWRPPPVGVGVGESESEQGSGATPIATPEATLTRRTTREHSVLRWGRGSSRGGAAWLASPSAGASDRVTEYHRREFSEADDDEGKGAACASGAPT